MTKNSNAHLPKKAKWQASIAPSGTEVESIRIPGEAMGHPGEFNDLMIVTQFEGDARSDEERTTDTAPRNFKISARLEKSHNFEYDNGLLVKKGFGSSFLTGNEGFTDLEYSFDGKKFQITKNDKGEYSYIELACEADNLSSVYDYFYSWVIWTLDHLAYLSAAPLFLGAVRVDDLKNNIIYLRNRAPYLHFHANITEVTYFSELRQIYAMYREALNSNSDFYKFFCFYKILEGMFNLVKPAIAHKLRKSGLVIDPIKDIVPVNENIPEQYKRYMGKSVRDFFDKVLSGSFRNGIAHFGDKGGVIDTSHHAHTHYYSSVLCITELCIRQMIVNSETLLYQIRENGE